jgi:hypothetical protein
LLGLTRLRSLVGLEQVFDKKVQGVQFGAPFYFSFIKKNLGVKFSTNPNLPRIFFILF